MRRSVSVLAAAVLALAIPLASGAATKTENYVLGPVGDTDGLCRLDPLNPTGLNIGTVCFAGLSGTRARLVIEDATGIPVAGNYVFVTSAGDAIGGAVEFCEQIATVAIPSGAARLVVYIAGPAFGPLACIDTGSPGIGTNGLVRLTTS
jgi:hypothetical protein